MVILIYMVMNHILIRLLPQLSLIALQCALLYQSVLIVPENRCQVVQIVRVEDSEKQRVDFGAGCERRL